MKKNSGKAENLRYCPEWTVGRKKGRPKKNKRTLGITDHIQNSGKKRKRARGTKRRGAESEIETILESEEVEAEEVDAINGLLQTDEVEPEIKGAIGNAD
jgi:hypothetical protein